MTTYQYLALANDESISWYTYHLAYDKYVGDITQGYRYLHWMKDSKLISTKEIKSSYEVIDWPMD